MESEGAIAASDDRPPEHQNGEDFQIGGEESPSDEDGDDLFKVSRRDVFSVCKPVSF